jgi:hypothetical protein
MSGAVAWKYLKSDHGDSKQIANTAAPPARNENCRSQSLIDSNNS